MNILFVVPYVPSLIRVRPYQLIRHLAARGHRITLATIWTNARERLELDEVVTYCADVRAVRLPAWRSLVNCVRALASDVPLQAWYSWSPALAAQIMEAASRVDIVHVEHLRGARYGISTRPGSDTPMVWDSVDCITNLFEQASRHRSDALGRAINRFELSRTRRHEGWLVTQFDRVLATSLADGESLSELSARAGGRANGYHRVSVLPNGVDLEYFTPLAEPRDSDTLVFSGKMSYHANERAVLHLVEDIMPRVWMRRPSTKLLVVGKDPSKAIRRAVAGVSHRVGLTGTVPDMRPYLRRAVVALVPLVYGVGCQNKVLEAMACGTPVVATPRAVSALRARAGRDVLVAEGAEAFANEVVDLLDSPRRQRDIGRAGRRYVEANHRWDQIAERLEQIYWQVLAARRPDHRAVGTVAHLTA